MGLIMEEIKHPKWDVLITVDRLDRLDPKEVWEQGDIIGLEIDRREIKSPNDLIKLGEWLIAQGQYVAKNYTATGRKAFHKPQLNK